MSAAGFSRPKDARGSSSPNPNPSANLYVANCGPAVGLPHDAIRAAFRSFGEVVAVHPADASGVRAIVCFAETAAAKEAFEAWNGKPCPGLDGRVLHIRYSVPRPLKKSLPSQEYIWCMTSLAWKKRRSFLKLWMRGHGKVYLKEGFSIMD